MECHIAGVESNANQIHSWVLIHRVCLQVRVSIRMRQTEICDLVYYTAHAGLHSDQETELTVQGIAPAFLSSGTYCTGCTGYRSEEDIDKKYFKMP